MGPDNKNRYHHASRALHRQRQCLPSFPLPSNVHDGSDMASAQCVYNVFPTLREPWQRASRAIMRTRCVYDNSGLGTTSLDICSEASSSSRSTVLRDAVEDRGRRSHPRVMRTRPTSQRACQPVCVCEWVHGRRTQGPRDATTPFLAHTSAARRACAR